ncbi:MAG: segregation and condensation protein [Rhodospirillaceae bacterium]|jgi:segregation and condensation protein B|nr:segregation and condensation protein [Rhodospirillaceae bacterium]
MSEDRFQLLRLLEAVLFASAEPIGEKTLAARLPEGADLPGLLQELAGLYANRGVHLIQIEDSWAFRTAPDMAERLQTETQVVRKLTRAAIETLAIVAYHQPVTRAEIEEIRGVALSRGTLDSLLEAGWIRPKGRRQTPGRPVTWVTTDAFLDHFGLESCDALPGVEELRAAGLLDSRSAISTLGAQAMAAVAPPEDAEGEHEVEEEAGDAEGEGAGSAADFEAAMAAAEAEVEEADEPGNGNTEAEK